MMKPVKIALLWAAMLGIAFAQAPQIPVTGTIGPGGLFAFRNASPVSFTSDANHTMTYPETSGAFVKLTSTVSLTATRNVAEPFLTNAQCFENLTTGGQAIQVIGASGTGVTIANGTYACVQGDGTNYITASGGSSGYFTGTPTVAVTGTPTSGQVLTATSGSAATFQTPSGGSAPLHVVYASSLSCPTPGIDLTSGLQPNGSSATDATTCLSNSLSSATPQTPYQLVLDSSYYGAIFGPAGGGWSVVAAHPSGIIRVPIATWSCTGLVSGTNTCTFTTVSANNLTANQYVNLGNFATSTAFNQSILHVISTGLSATQFEATSTVLTITGSATETGEADALYGDGLFAPQGLNNDVIHNGTSAQTGLCYTHSGSLYSDPGWVIAGLPPPRGEGVTIRGIALNGNRGNGTTGNSTSGQYNGIGNFSSLYGSAYCDFMGINLANLENIVIDGVTIFNTPAYNLRLINDGHIRVVNSNFQQVLPNGPATLSNAGQNGDGIHVSAPGNDIYIDNDFFTDNDDSIALNAPEGWPGQISRVQVTNSSFHNTLTGMRAYTGSIVSPQGASPGIDHVSISNYNGDSTYVFGVFGYFYSGTRTFTVPNSITDFTWANSRLTGAASGFIVDDTFGTLTLDNIDQESVTCSNGANGFLTSGQNAEVIASLTISNSHIIRTPAGHCQVGAVDSLTNGGTLTSAHVNLNGFGVIDLGATYSNMADLLNLSAGSTIGSYVRTGVDFSKIALEKSLTGTITNSPLAFFGSPVPDNDANHGGGEAVIFGSAGTHQAQLEGINPSTNRAAFILSGNFGGTYQNLHEFGTDLYLNGTNDFYIFDNEAGIVDLDIAATTGNATFSGSVTAPGIVAPTGNVVATAGNVIAPSGLLESGSIAGNGTAMGSTFAAGFVAGTPTWVLSDTTASLSLNGVVGWPQTTPDTGFSRTAAGVVALGNGTAGNAGGTLNLNLLNASGTVAGANVTATASITDAALTVGQCVFASTGGVLQSTGAPCYPSTFKYSRYWSIAPGVFATSSLVGPVYFYELSAGTYVPTSTVITARLAGTISCTGAPVLGLYDLGTSATTAFGSSTQVATLTTGTTDGVYTTTTGSLTFNGQHYYGIGIVSGTCVTAPQIDVTINW